MEIYTYGSGQFIASVLEAVKALTTGGVILSTLKVFLIAGLLSALTATTLRAFGTSVTAPLAGDTDNVFSPMVIMIRNVFLGALAVNFFLNPVVVTDVAVEDRYDPVQSRVVTGVPVGIAFVGHVSSVIGDRMGQVIDELITPVDAVRFRTGGGVGIGPKYLNELFDIVPPGPESEYNVGTSNVPIRGVVEAWFSECIYTKFALIEGEGPRANGLQAFSRSGFFLADPALLQPPFNDPNSPLTVQFYGYPDANETTCNNAPAQIMARWYNNNLFEAWLARFSARAFGTKENDPTVVPRVYDMVDRYFPGAEYGTQDRLVQLALMNTAYQAYLKMVSEYSSTGASDISRRKQVGSWLEMARVGSRTLFIMRQVAEAALYLFGAFLPVFIAAAGLGALVKYAKGVFWLQLWIPIFVVFNAISDFYLLKAVDSVSYCTSGACSLPLNWETVDKLRTETGMIVGYLGILSMTAPGLAWGIMRGVDSLGGMVGGVMSTHIAGRVGGDAITQRTGALTSYTAGTMLSSTHQAGIGQARAAGEQYVADKWGLGAFQNVAGLAVAESISSGAPQAAGRIMEATATGPIALTESGAIGLARSVATNIASRDTYDYMQKEGLVPESMSYSEYERTTHLSSTANTSSGVLTTHFSPDGKTLFGILKGAGENGSYEILNDAGKRNVAGRREGFFKFTDSTGAERTMYGSLTMRGGGFSAEGVEPKTFKKLSLAGEAQDVDLAKGQVSGYRVFSEEGRAGASDHANVSKAEALQMLSPLQGTGFYKGVESMKEGGVSLSMEKNASTGEIASVTATQGGRSFKFDHSGALTGSREVKEALREVNDGYREWTGSRVVREDLQVSNTGTRTWEGYQKVMENTDTKTGIFKDIDPETGKEAMYYGRWHYDRDTGKQVSADFTNLATRKISTVRTATAADGSQQRHYGVGTYQSGQGGAGMVSDFRELSHEEIQKGMYAATRTRGQAGEVLHEKDVAGQEVRYDHSFTMNLEKRANVNILTTFGGEGDLVSSLTDLEKNTIIWVGAASNAANTVNQIGGLGRTIEGARSGGPKLPSLPSGIPTVKADKPRITADKPPIEKPSVNKPDFAGRR